MKKITLLLFTFCAITLSVNAQINVSDSPALAIPDNDPVGVTTTIDVGATTGTITSMTVDLDVDHTWNGDLYLEITSPSATTVAIYDRPGVPATGNGCNDDGMVINLADGHPGDLEVCVGSGDPYPAQLGDYNPSNPLSAFNGETATGTWTILVSDNAGGDLGTLMAWGLNIDGPVLGLESNTIEGFTFSPNPVKDNLNLRAAHNIEAVSVFNLLGQEVMRSMPNAISNDLNMSALQTGAYFVKVTVNGVTETIRVIKQ